MVASVLCREARNVGADPSLSVAVSGGQASTALTLASLLQPAPTETVLKLALRTLSDRVAVG
ncbi:hypothetical protein SAMN06297144_3495 [Sphingomonas guangdongensis]|uniref:Uncharacterized protein n=1 Tax=Sphingomonas guangdongensis TaxID=1141890 RepID=A0A285R392_9SPHN|nr:hypothetical protein SAMN06297144_3495 [Sphingomonas guangdongensis]